MDEGTPHIEVRAVTVDDAPALHQLDVSFETDRIYTLHVQNQLLPEQQSNHQFLFELVETPVDPPVYKNLRNGNPTLQDIEQELSQIEGGYVALVDGAVAGAILLTVEDWRQTTRVENFIIGRQFRRYGLESLLLSCTSDWARKRNCWAVVLETQNSNYPAIQFYLHQGLEIWGINQHYYPPGENNHEVALILGKRLSSTPT